MEINPIIIDVTDTTAETLFWPPGMPYHKRVTRFYEIELITGGAGKMTTNQKSYCTMQGDLFFRKPGSVTQGIAGYYGYGIAFDPIESEERKSFYGTTIPYWITDTNSQIEDYGFFDSYPDCYHSKHYKTLEPIFSEINRLFTMDPLGNQDTLKNMMKQVFEVVEEECRCGNIVKTSGNVLQHYDKIAACKQYIDNNLEKHFTLEELAAQCELSKNYFSKIFKEITGMTPFEYIIENRMLLARKLILTTNICIDQIVFLCGFDDRTYFYRMFKKRFHSTPALYRKEFIEEIQRNE